MGGSREGVRVLKIQIRSKITENKHAPPGKHIHIYSVLLFILKLTPPPFPGKKILDSQSSATATALLEINKHMF